MMNVLKLINDCARVDSVVASVPYFVSALVILALSACINLQQILN
jgi:hypothetical protein